MGTDVKQKIDELIETIKGFNVDPKICDQRAKACVITKLEEASMWFDKVVK